MFDPNVSSAVRAALLLVSLMCAHEIIANPRDSHFVAVMNSSSLDQSPQMFSATGRVIDAVTAQPVAGVHFVYGVPDNSTNNGGFVSFEMAQANASGDFKLQHLKRG